MKQKPTVYFLYCGRNHLYLFSDCVHIVGAAEQHEELLQTHTELCDRLLSGISIGAGIPYYGFDWLWEEVFT